MEVPALERTLTELDHIRLTQLVQRHGGASPAADLLDTADTAPSRAIAPDVVTMYSQVLLRDVDSGQRRTLTLTYPAEADPGAGLVSVLSPVGCGLLGLRVGAVARWRNPVGGERRAEVLALLFQPEASGDYTR